MFYFPDMKGSMMKKLTFAAAMFVLSTMFAAPSFALDFNSLADQSSYACAGGIVAVGDLDRDVRETCGDPFQIGSRQDYGPIWIYYEDQARFMYYLAFVNGKLQRIVSAPCTPDDPACLDLE